MPVPLTNYARIKNRYCICYYGPCDEYIVQLINLRPLIEKNLPGLQIFISCKDDLDYLVKNQERIVLKSKILEEKKNFAHLRQLKCNMEEHPVYSLLEESNINLNLKVDLEKEYSKKCVITPMGILPTKSLSPNQIEHLKNVARNKGFTDVIVGDDISGAGLVIGVENSTLFQAAFKGIRTILVDTGLGKQIYKLITNGEVIEPPKC